VCFLRVLSLFVFFFFFAQEENLLRTFHFYNFSTFNNY